MGGRALNPLSIVLLVTYRCNLRCKMCFYYNESEIKKTGDMITRRKDEELSFERIKELIDEMEKMKIRVMTLHGGEPLIYPGIFDIASYARDRGIAVNFVTNGTMISQNIAERIVKAKISGITFSIDGPEDIHDEVRSMKGVFAKVISGIGFLKELEKAGKKIPNIQVSTYISAINQEKIEELYEILKEMKIKNWGVGLITYNSEKMEAATRKILHINTDEGQGGLENLTDEVKNIKEEVLLEQREKIKKANKHYRMDIIFPTEKAVKKYYDSYYNEKDFCLYPWARTVISPYGEVFPCVNLSMVNYSLGNIKEKSLKEIWNSAEYIEFRKKLKKNKLLPICSKCCVINNVKKL